MKTFVLSSIVFVLAMFCGQAQAFLVSYWSFDTDFTADEGGSGFDLTAVNGATAGDPGGKFGNAASFECANGEYAFTGGDVLTAGEDFSYSAWHKLGVDPELGIVGGDRYFVLETTLNDTPSGDQAWVASIGLRDLGAGDVVQVFYSPSAAVGDTPAALGVWQNVTVTYDADGGTNSGGIVNAYLDGSGTPFATLDDTPASNPVSGLVIGGHRAGTGRNFDGQVDAVSFYDHVLSSDEITGLQTAPFVSSVIPEPSSVVLIGLGSLVAVSLLRRRQS
ncbi:MAG: LamG-like jellyroll fold domain-containing protein [Aeoliella sp.]